MKRTSPHDCGVCNGTLTYVEHGTWVCTTCRTVHHECPCCTPLVRRKAS